MLNWIAGNRTIWHFNWVQTDDLRWIELSEIELFDEWTAFKQTTDI